MQLIEFLLWMTVKSDNKKTCSSPKTNKLISKIGIIINHLEPIVLWLSILIENFQNLLTY